MNYAPPSARITSELDPGIRVRGLSVVTKGHYLDGKPLIDAIELENDPTE